MEKIEQVRLKDILHELAYWIDELHPGQPKDWGKDFGIDINKLFTKEDIEDGMENPHK